MQNAGEENELNDCSNEERKNNAMDHIIVARHGKYGLMSVDLTKMLQSSA